MILTMSEKVWPGISQEVESKPPLHRLRRYPHNGFIRTSQVMTGDMLNKGNHKTTYLVLSILLLSSLPLVSNASADQGIPEELQAQDIDAVFDPVTETTTVTWRNIAQSGGDFDLFEELWDSTYHVYRSGDPITPQVLETLQPWHSVVACDSESNEPWGANPNKCRGSEGNHPGHSATFQVGAGTDGVFFYAISTELSNGNITDTLTVNSSILYEPIIEVATPIRSPYNIVATFNPETSQTFVQWINYNSINPILPEDGLDAYEIHLWRTENQVDRSNGFDLLQGTPIAILNATDTQVYVDVPPMTSRESYYSVTYLLPNWTAPGVDYEDTRFLSNNAMSNAILEDNTPPTDVSTVEALFTPSEDGTGVTTIVWDDILSEDGEQYRIYRHGEYFNTTNNPYVQLVGTVQEGVSEFQYTVPFSTYGDFVYCVVIVDQFGSANPVVPISACDIVSEDSDEGWVKEPTNVNATFIGDGVTRVTWTDQAGIEGERYHIWKSTYRVQGAQFTQNQSLMWQGSVPDGIEQFDVQLPDGLTSATSHYFVTSEALYNCQGCNGTMMYTKLVQNWDGPIVEDTMPPQTGRMLAPQMIGELKVVDLEWQNSASEDDETYSLYRHFGDPFGDAEFAVSNYTDSGWELVDGPIPENGFSTMIRQIPVPDNTQRDVWYALIISDSYGNTNPEILPGENSVLVSEDTMPPSITYAIHDEDNVPITGTSLVRGDYTLRIEVSETLDEEPMINMSTSNGGSLTGDTAQAMIKQSENSNNPNKGPEYFHVFSIASTATAGEILTTINLTDLSLNTVDIEITDFAIDAKAPVVTIFSPTDQNDGAKYLYGNEIKVVAGATDDVEIVSMQIRFVQNYGTSSSVTEPWRDVTGLTINEDGDWTIEMAVSSGNYLPGMHEVSVKATDSAGNERTQKVKFITDWCRHRGDGETICEYSNPVESDPEVVYPELNATDPPYMIAWVTAGISLLAVIASLFVISSAMSGPKKKKGDDDDEGDDWMNEFIGTSAEPDMAEITGGAPAEKKKEATPEPEEDDPFAVNVIQPKRRRKKSSDDDDDDDDDKPKRKTKRRAAGRRKATKRKRS